MPQSKHIVFIAGEESGDKYASEIIQSLRQVDNTIEFSGIGGQHMSSIGVKLVSDLARHGVTGFTEVIRHFITIKNAFKAIKRHLIITKPDLLVLIDYPGFNLRLAKYAKQVLGLKIIYYISPQIWAWKQGRIHSIKKNIDHMAVILPFEKALYQQAGIKASFVGHPLVKRIEQFKKKALSKAELGISKNKKILAVLPGSRVNEVNKHLSILVQSVKKIACTNKNLQLVIPVAKSLDTQMIDSRLKNCGIDYHLVDGHALDVINHASAVVVASGTASLECALLAKPMCIVYKASSLTYMIALQVIKVKYLGLANLLLGKMVVPELLQYDFNAVSVTEVLNLLLNDSEYSRRMILQLSELQSCLTSQHTDNHIVGLILREMKI